MADSVKAVDYFYVHAPNQPGEAARMLRHLQKQGVNLLAFSGFPKGRGAQLDFVPANTKAFLKAAQAAGWKLSKQKTGFLIRGRDRVGALNDSLEKLARRKINVTAVDGVSAGAGRFGAILWVKPKDVPRAAKILGA